MDVIALLKLIRSLLMTGAATRHAIHAILDAQDKFMMFRQTPRMENAVYYKRFKALFAAYEHLVGDVGILLTPPSQYVKAVDPDKATAKELKEAREVAKDAYLAIRLLRHSAPGRYGALLADIENNHTCGVSSYPVVLSKAYDYLVNYVNPS